MRLPFNPLAIVWDARQLLWLGLGYAAPAAAVLLRRNCARARLDALPAGDRPPLRRSTSSAPGSERSASSASCSCSRRTPRCASSPRPASSRDWRSPCASTGPRARDAGARRGARCSSALWLPPGLTALHPHISEYKGLAMALRVPGRAHRRGALEPARPDQRGREPGDPVPPCARPVAQQHHRAAASSSASSPTPTRSARSRGSTATSSAQLSRLHHLRRSPTTCCATPRC